MGKKSGYQGRFHARCSRHNRYSDWIKWRRKSKFSKRYPSLKAQPPGRCCSRASVSSGRPPHEIIQIRVLLKFRRRWPFPRMTVLGESRIRERYCRKRARNKKKSFEQVYSHFPVLKERAKTSSRQFERRTAADVGGWPGPYSNQSFFYWMSPLSAWHR